ncbi:MAG: ATP-binding cassette domain-containing protein, partial [Desulfobacterales bacterium]
MAEEQPIIQLRGISKTFPGVKALSDIDLDIRQGEVHVLVGENGAGKSSLVNVLSGIYVPDSGTMTFDGEPYQPQ